MFGCSLRCDLLSERNLKSQERAKMLASSKDVTFESKVSDALAAYTESMMAIGFLGGEPDYEKALTAACEHNRLYIESCELTTNESWRNIFDNAVNSTLSFYLVLSPLPQFDFDIMEEIVVNEFPKNEHSIQLTWKDIHIKAKIPQGGCCSKLPPLEKEILRGVSGAALPGDFISLIGA